MTTEEKIAALEHYCDGQYSCDECKCVPNEDGFCYSGPIDVMEANYERVFGNDQDNPYWQRITAIADKQRAKGMSKYGQGLESNPADILERINHLQEELIDGLMYCEWIKELVREGAGEQN